MPRKGLGKGLSDLISADSLKQGATLLELRPHEIEPNPFQPRSDIDDDQLEELTRSIERHGVVQPLVVRPVGTGYQLVTGERRWRAAQRAGLATIPCLVRDTSDSEALQIALVENLQREDLNPIDAAHGYHQLVEDFGLTQEQVASIVGKSRAAVANTLRLLDLPDTIQDMVESGMLTEGHARALLPLVGVGDGWLVQETAENVATSGITVRDTEDLVRDKLQGPPAAEAGVSKAGSATPARPEDPNVADLEERLQLAIGTRVRIRTRLRGGTINIQYHNYEELERIVRVLDPQDSRFGEFD